MKRVFVIHKLTKDIKYAFKVIDMKEIASRLDIVIILFLILCLESCFSKHSSVSVYPLRPVTPILCGEDELYYTLKVDSSSKINWNLLDGTLEYISHEYDCSDFRFVNLIRILYEYGDKMPIDTYDKTKSVLSNFRFWWNDSGENSMCYWSENHQILFASAEYLLGLYFKDVYFNKAQLNGIQLAERGKKRILDWLELRWLYGFSEYYSNVYYKEDIAALINLVDFAPDDIIKKKSAIILDLLFYDLASQCFKGNMVSTSARAYKHNRQANNFENLYNDFFSLNSSCKNIHPGMLCGLKLTKNYVIPKVLLNIANDTNSVIVKQSNGIELCDLDKLGFLGQSDKQLMVQFGMEAFVNPEVVQNTLMAMSDKKMFSNAFLSDLKRVDIPLLKKSGLLPDIIRVLNPYQIGTVLNKAYTYTYRTGFFSMYTSQAYYAGLPSDQHHIFGLNTDDDITIYHTHPACKIDNNQSSPNFWVGYGRLPYSVQDKNINISIYNIPKKKAFLEKELLDYTYLYIPCQKVDTVLIDSHYVFVKYKNTCCAFIASGDISRENDLFYQKGNKQYWITEIGILGDDKDFASFINRIKSNKCIYNNKKNSLEYYSKGKKYTVIYNKKFSIDNEDINLKYDDYDSPYIHQKRNEKNRLIKCALDSLSLNFYEGIRLYNK